MQASRSPRGPLRQFVKLLWYADAPGHGHARERVLATGSMHIVIRLVDDPLRVYADIGAREPLVVGTATIGGARTAFYVKDATQPTCSLGAVLEPAASLPMLGVSALELSGRHTRLDDVWGPSVDAVRDRLCQLASPDERLRLFEAELARRLSVVRGAHPAIGHALARIGDNAQIGTIVDEIGFSHRWFVTAFRDAVGLTPKAYSRVQRLQRVLRARRETAASWAAVAAAAGFSDQAHLTRELGELAGVSPGELARIATGHDNHLPITSDKFKTRGARRSTVAA